MSTLEIRDLHASVTDARRDAAVRSCAAST